MSGPFIRAKCEAPSRIILEAGARIREPTAIPCAVGSRMAIHASNILETAATTSNPRLGYLTVTTVHPYTSVLKVPSDTKPFWFPAVLYCLIEYLSSLHVALYCANGRIVQKLGFEAKFSEFKIQNIVGSCFVFFLLRGLLPWLLNSKLECC
jgi:hypothetical protein